MPTLCVYMDLTNLLICFSWHQWNIKYTFSISHFKCRKKMIWCQVLFRTLGCCDYLRYDHWLFKKIKVFECSQKSVIYRLLHVHLKIISMSIVCKFRTGKIVVEKFWSLQKYLSKCQKIFSNKIFQSKEIKIFLKEI